MRVLVVDDSIISQEILKDMLESMTFDVLTAGSGKEALVELSRAIGEENPYQLVLMDWKMPHMDGVETAGRIKKSFKESVQPAVIMVTAYGREEVMKRAKHAGIKGFLVKPVNASVLFNTIMEVFGKEIETKRVRKISRALDSEALDAIFGARILLVEDNEINQQVASEILENAGLVVKIANHGKEAVEKVQTDEFDAVLMDLQMPVMDGMTATSEIRKWEAKFRIPHSAPRIPIIAMTAHAMAEDREKSLKAGMDDHVVKPIDPNELFSALIRWIKPDPERIRRAELLRRAREGETDLELDESVLPSELPGIAIESGLATVAGNEKLYRKLLGKFLESNADVVDEIRTNLKRKDMETASRLAHTVKGVAGNLGFTDLYPAAGELEKAIKKKETEAFDVLIDDFETHLNVVLKDIEELEKRDAAKKTKEVPADEKLVDIETVKPLLVEMGGLLETDLMEAMNRLENLRPHLEASEVQEEFKKLETCLENFDTDEALRNLEEIAGVLGISLN